MNFKNDDAKLKYVVKKVYLKLNELAENDFCNDKISLTDFTRLNDMVRDKFNHLFENKDFNNSQRLNFILDWFKSKAVNLLLYGSVNPVYFNFFKALILQFHNADLI